MTNEERFIAFCDELRAYVEEHHLFPDKHTRLSHKVKYTRKKINNFRLEVEKSRLSNELMGNRSIKTFGDSFKMKSILV